MNIPSNIFSFDHDGIMPSCQVDSLDPAPLIGKDFSPIIGKNFFDDEVDTTNFGLMNKTLAAPQAPSSSLISMLSRPPLAVPSPPLLTPPRGNGNGNNGNGQNAPRQNSLPKQKHYKPVQEEKWTQRLTELRLFREQRGHCHIPHCYEPNRQLARWVKRQRRQYKLLREGKPSTLSIERIEQLEDVGFVWDSHSAAWRQKIDELLSYRARHGNCLVPSTYKKDPQLAIWVKCQRRQWRLWKAGRNSSMTAERAAELEKIGFVFEVRTAASSSCSSTPSSPPSPRLSSSPDGTSSSGSSRSSSSCGTAAFPENVASCDSDAIAVAPLAPTERIQGEKQNDLLAGGLPIVPDDDFRLLFETISRL